MREIRIHSLPFGLMLLLLILTPFVSNSQTINSRSQASGCATIDIVIVSDLAFHSGNEAAARTRLMNIFTKTQELFLYSFNIELRLRVKDIIIPSNESPFPKATDDVDGMIDVQFHMTRWLRDNNYDILKYDIVLGVTHTLYNVNYWGFCTAEDKMLALIVMQLRGEDYEVRLMAHELGHAFGASHDTGASLMSPGLASGSWSAKTKEEVNAFLEREQTRKFFGACPTLTFDGSANGLNVALNWAVNFEEDVTGYVLYENGVVIDTVQAKGPSTNPLTYNFQHTTDSDGEKVYWLHQISKWGTVLENENAVVMVGNVEHVAFDGYPNPFLDTLRVIPVEPGTKVVVYNSTSQRVFEQVVMGDKLTLNTSSWTPGLYVIMNAGRVRRVLRR